MKLLTALLKLVTSPEEPDPEDPRAVRAHKHAMVIWRQWIGYSQLGLWCFFFWAIGAGSAVGIDAFGQGFARAAVVERVEVHLLSQAIVQDRIRHCAAATTDGATYFWNQMQLKIDEYYDLTGKDYKLPDCKDLAGIN